MRDEFTRQEAQLVVEELKELLRHNVSFQVDAKAQELSKNYYVGVWYNDDVFIALENEQQLQAFYSMCSYVAQVREMKNV